MALPESVDLDKLLTIVLECTKKALHGWQTGAPRDEIAFVNQLTAQLARVRRGCDVGLAGRVVARVKVAELHRSASDSSDLYGSDLAVTVLVDPGDYTKTALFQVKKGVGFSALLERHQIEAATATKEIAERSFVCYVDEARPGLRIAKAADLLIGWSATKATKTFRTAKWQALSKWAADWLSCEVGAVSEHRVGRLEQELKEHDAYSGSDYDTVEAAHSPLAWLIFGMQAEGRDVAGEAFAPYFEDER